MEQNSSPDTTEQTLTELPPSPPRRPLGTLLLILLVGGAVAWIAVRFGQGMTDRFESRLQWQSDADTALRLAQEKNLPVLMVFTSDACVHCKRLKAGVLSTRESDDAIDGRAVPAMLDTGLARNRELLEQFGSNYVPTVVIADPAGKLIAMFKQAPANLPSWVINVTEQMKKQ